MDITKYQVADYRGDEGLRIRKELISPTLTAHSGGGVTTSNIYHNEEDESQGGNC